MNRLLSANFLIVAAIFLQGLWHGYYGFGWTTVKLILWCWLNVCFINYILRRKAL